MRRKLLALNVVLLGATIYAGAHLRNQCLAAKAREAAMLRKKLKPAPPPPVTRMAEAPPVTPSGYADIAQKMLFDRSRNSTVEVPPPPAPPPPAPPPPFPILRGMMNLGDGLTAVFSEKASGPPQEVKPGQKIGQFTLVSVNEQEAVFAWSGKNYRKAVEEILDRSREAPAETSRPAAPPPSAAAAAPPKVAAGPGAETGAGTRACVLNDGTAAGAVVDGYRKVVTRTPFGEACRWEAAGR